MELRRVRVVSPLPVAGGHHARRAGDVCDLPAVARQETP